MHAQRQVKILLLLAQQRLLAGTRNENSGRPGGIDQQLHVKETDSGGPVAHLGLKM